MTFKFLVSFVISGLLIYGYARSSNLPENITLDCGTLKGTGSVTTPLGKGKYGHIIIECEGIKV